MSWVYEHDGLGVALPELDELFLHGLAGLRIEGAEGLVHPAALGSIASTRASATRCFIPPDSSAG